MSKGKRILVLYQDWGNWFEDHYQKFEYWFKQLDGAYDENNEYYFVAFGNENKVIKKEKNIFIKLIKSTPQKQLFGFKKFKTEVEKAIKEFKPDYIYSPYIYLLSNVPKSDKYKTIGYLRDITALMILSNKNIKALFGLIFFYLDYLAFKRIDLILYNRKSLIKYLKKLGFNGEKRYNPRPIADINHYNKKPKIDVVKKFNLENKKVVFTVSRLSAEKNVEMGIKAMKYLPEDFVYLIAGEGHLKEKLQNLVKDLNLEKRVKFIGYVKHKNIWDYYRVSNIFWLLSKTEAMPNVLQEAFYAKLPCIVSKIEAMKNIINSGKDGFCLKTWNEKELAEKTIEIIKDKKLYCEIQNEGFRKISSIVKQNKKLLEYFK